MTVIQTGSSYREEANRRAFEQMVSAEPMLVDVAPAGSVVPGFTKNTILTSGAPMPWDEYVGGQRTAILGGAVFEGLARDFEEADAKLRSGEIVLGACHDHGCVGSLAGVVTATMPVFVVENETAGNRAFCTIYEGSQRERLAYGVYNEGVHRNLEYLRDTVGPMLQKAIQHSGGIALKPIMRRALQMGDELHTRNNAATLLFAQELFPSLLELSKDQPAETRKLLDFLSGNPVFFLHLSMVASKSAADSASNIEGSSVVVAMAVSGREFGIRVSGTGSEWFRAPIPDVEGMFFEGYTKDDVGHVGGESLIAETIGLGGFAQAAAFPLQRYNGGTVAGMIENTLKMYEITIGENPHFAIPYLSYRGTPTGIDIHRVISSKITPVIDMGLAHRDGGQIGAGIMWAPYECFEGAMAAYEARYGKA